MVLQRWLRLPEEDGVSHVFNSYFSHKAPKVSNIGFHWKRSQGKKRSQVKKTREARWGGRLERKMPIRFRIWVNSLKVRNTGLVSALPKWGPTTSLQDLQCGGGGELAHQLGLTTAKKMPIFRAMDEGEGCQARLILSTKKMWRKISDHSNGGKRYCSKKRLFIYNKGHCQAEFNKRIWSSQCWGL